ncbi:hypothetical protein [Hymenobacter crusticola]|uniref:Uncharacterized protein n=1 Tax=Hymenobacter crusticola TaxID=1770526 RepID=A0A243W6D5_9BACT|nr:hypothetical protein [Hymenobacter crusticola]OUJ67053.1 hypothetical protein BXP70_28940 [Hymenobacter crusticola]
MKLLRLLLLAIILIYPGLSAMTIAQPPLPSANAFRLAGQHFQNAQQQLNYVAPLQALLSHKAQLEPNMYAQTLATHFSFVGQLPAQTTKALPAAYQTLPLDSLLLARAQATSMVIINEAHDQPAHRAYCRQLLPQLARLGYSLLAVEALNPSDTAFNQRQYPVATSGYYTCEPAMGNLLRAAAEQGYYVFGHEIRVDQEKELADFNKRQQYRDSLQAVNMLAVLRQHPGAKVVALVGYDHLAEKERSGIKRFATYLRELGQVDPLTIDQTSDYRLPASATRPMVLATAGKVPTVSGEYAGQVDLQVLHPPLTRVQGRPRWLAASMGTKALVQPIPARYVGTACLVQLYDQGEYTRQGDKAIPLDQYLTNATQKQVYLFPFASGRAVVVKYRPAKLPKG